MPEYVLSLKTGRGVNVGYLASIPTFKKGSRLFDLNPYNHFAYRFMNHELAERYRKKLSKLGWNVTIEEV